MTESKALAEAGHVPAPAAGTEEMSGLVRLALERGHPVEVLERLVALQERVTEREARMEFFDALARFQEEVGQISKSKTAEIVTKAGGRYRYTYAPLDEIARHIREPLRRNGFSYTWNIEAAGERMVNVTAVLRHVGGHEERASFPVPVDTAAAMSEAQKYGAALTYGKRQSLTSVLGLTCTDDDVDGAELGGRELGTITGAQAADLEALISEVKADEARFLRWLGFSSLEEIPADDLPRAIKALEDKRKGVSK